MPNRERESLSLLRTDGKLTGITLNTRKFSVPALRAIISYQLNQLPNTPARVISVEKNGKRINCPTGSNYLSARLKDQIKNDPASFDEFLHEVDSVTIVEPQSTLDQIISS